MPRRYLLSRIAQAALVLWAAFTVSFILLQLLPGDAVLIKFLNPELGLGPQEIADIRAAYGSDQPVWQQYLHTLGQFLTGHFGYSLQAGVPVSQGLATSLPPTLKLAALGFADRKSTRLNSSHQIISYAVFCLKKKKTVCSPSQTDTTHPTILHATTLPTLGS